MINSIERPPLQVTSGNAELSRIEGHKPSEIHILREDPSWPICGVRVPYEKRFMDRALDLLGLGWNGIYNFHPDESVLRQFISEACELFPGRSIVEEHDVFSGVIFKCKSLNSKYSLIQFHYESLSWRQAYFLNSRYGEIINFLIYQGEKDKQWMGCVIPRHGKMLTSILDQLAVRGAIVKLDEAYVDGPAVSVSANGEVVRLRYFPDSNPLHLLMMARPISRNARHKHTSWPSEIDIPIGEWGIMRQQLNEKEIPWEGVDPDA